MREPLSRKFRACDEPPCFILLCVNSHSRMYQHSLGYPMLTPLTQADLFLSGTGGLIVMSGEGPTIVRSLDNPWFFHGHGLLLYEPPRDVEPRIHRARTAFADSPGIDHVCLRRDRTALFVPLPSFYPQPSTGVGPLAPGRGRQAHGKHPENHQADRFFPSQHDVSWYRSAGSPKPNKNKRRVVAGLSQIPCANISVSILEVTCSLSNHSVLP
jgi:hypothetical protein